MTIAVVGSGPGALALAADLTVAPREVVLADDEAFMPHLDALREQGGVRIGPGWRGDEVVEVAVADSIEAAVKEAETVVVCVAPAMYERFAARLAGVVHPGAMLVVVGTGGGALVFKGALERAGRHDVTVGETNCLPHVARPVKAGHVTVIRKTGGVLLAAVPVAQTPLLVELFGAVWPSVEAAGSVWETALVNFDAIDIVPVAIANAARLEARPGGTLFWGEGATPSVVRLIEAVDGELLALRGGLGHTDRRRYKDFLVAQGLAPDLETLYEMMQGGSIRNSIRPTGSTEALIDRLRVDVPWSLVLGASIGDALDLPTPTIDSMITIAGVLAGTDYWTTGRTLASLGLAGASRDDLRRAVGLT